MLNICPTVAPRALQTLHPTHKSVGNSFSSNFERFAKGIQGIFSSLDRNSRILKQFRTIFQRENTLPRGTGDLTVTSGLSSYWKASKQLSSNFHAQVSIHWHIFQKLKKKRKDFSFLIFSFSLFLKWGKKILKSWKIKLK